MQKPNSTEIHYTPIQLKLPLEIERIIDISDPVYSINEILDHIDLKEFLAAKECIHTVPNTFIIVNQTWFPDTLLPSSKKLAA